MLEVFELQYKNSIKYGMTYEQFWFGCPSLYYIYEDVYIEKLKERDYFNWQKGVYMQYAIASCLDDKIKYPEQPLFYAHKEKTVSYEDMIRKFQIMADSVNKKFE